VTGATVAGPSLRGLVARACAHDPHAVATLVSAFQDRRDGARGLREEVLDQLDREVGPRDAVVIGMTGTPGSGKSSLVARLSRELLRADRELTIAVLAVDPSSSISGGALLGDRTRMGAGADPRLYFRSEAADAELGGLSPSSFQVCRLLARLFGAVIVETVGIGQSEGDIRHLADHVYLVLAPLGGDELQLMKAGIVEIPDAFIVNKSDEASAADTYHRLRASLWLARPEDADRLPVFRTSAKTGAGIAALRDAVADQIAAGPAADRSARDRYFLERYVKDEWGRAGVAYLRGPLGGAGGALDRAGSIDAALAAFARSFARSFGDAAVR
jgi:LAO/AO transport system kinase